MKYVTKGKETVKQISTHLRLCVFRSTGHFKFFKMYYFKDTQSVLEKVVFFYLSQMQIELFLTEPSWLEHRNHLANLNSYPEDQMEKRMTVCSPSVRHMPEKKNSENPCSQGPWPSNQSPAGELPPATGYADHAAVNTSNDQCSEPCLSSTVGHTVPERTLTHWRYTFTCLSFRCDAWLPRTFLSLNPYSGLPVKQCEIQ